MAAADTTFNQHRNLLFTLVYEILGSVHDAEDVVQETWLAWATVEADQIEHPKAYLVRIAVRQALARSRRLRAAREDYVGPWLPEPLLTAADPAEAAFQAEELTFGLLVVLETLSPLERAAFVLREGFGYEHAEIARLLERSPAAARQLIHRAREHVQARRPRFPADPDLARQAAERFLAATLGGHLGDLMDVLARRHPVDRRRRRGAGRPAPGERGSQGGTPTRKARPPLWSPARPLAPRQPAHRAADG
ncbi:sigma-70 family RNA polymerase sigma factor [Nonomuraea salmonea]|uniref:sigma-70 family RNA polymerase sigma factor n=1 Tax=Nonomuraea salmonea TaxID=46181 RepID=UPI003622BEE7